MVKQARNLTPINLNFSDQRVFAQTFGHFEVFLNDEAVYFNYPKAKELLALIVDRKGGYLSAIDAIGCLWEELPLTKSLYAKYRKTAMQLKAILERNGIEYIIEVRNGKRRANIDRFDCDYYQFMTGNKDAVKGYAGQYMIDYSWAEETIAVLETMRSNLR